MPLSGQRGVRARTLLAAVATAASLACARVPSGSPPGSDTESGPRVERIETLKRGGARVDWSHQVDRIAFDMAGGDGFFDVYTMKPDGSDVVCATCDHPDLPGRHIGQPAWHPSGKYIAFQAEKAEHPRVRWEMLPAPGAGVYNDLWILSLDTGRAHRLREVANEEGNGVLHPHFSRDGRRLSWSEMREKGGVRKGKELGYWSLMVADFVVDRGGLPRLLDVRSFEPGGRAFYENHGFSPDGSRLIFSSNWDASFWFLNDIYVLDLQSESLTRLTDEGYNEHAIYSPDGRHIVWISTVGNGRWAPGTDYWIMRSDGTDKRRLTYFNERGHPHHAGKKVIVADLSWSPDGTKFVGYYRAGGSLESPDDDVEVLLIELSLDEAKSGGESSK